MTTRSKHSSRSTALTIRFHLADGTVHSFVQADAETAQDFLQGIDPAKLFSRPRIVVGSEHSKAVFVSGEIVRVDFIQEGFQCWRFPAGYSDIVELSEREFCNHAHLDQPERMTKRDQPTPVGNLLVSFVQLQMRGSPPVFAMAELEAKLPAESQSFMHFLLSKGAIHMRLRGSGIGVLNLSNLVAYAVYPGVAQIPGDSWVAEPVRSHRTEHLLTR
jgi:hypothetical protein